MGTITAVEDVPNSDKLVRLTVDFGDHQRRIVAGIRQERADPREIQPERRVPNGARAG